MPNAESTPKAMDSALICEHIKVHYSGLLHLLSRKLRDRELTRDLLNEAVAVTLEHAREGRLTSTESIGGYVFQVSMNLLRNYRRESSNRVDLQINIDETLLASAFDHESAERAQLRATTRRIIESLPSKRDREAIKRYYLNEEEKDDICREMGLTTLQLTLILSRARQRLKSIFDSSGVRHKDLLTTLFLAGIT